MSKAFKKPKLPNELPNEVDKLNDVTPDEKIDLKQLRLTYGMNIPEPEPILSQGDTLLMSRGNISTIKGQAKSRKTFFVNILTAVFLGSRDFGLNTDTENGKVLIIDSEMSRAHSYKSFKRVYSMLDWTANNDRLIFFALREVDLLQRVAIMKQAIEEYNPDLVVLDGLLDFVNDSNDNVESREFIQTLSFLSSKFNCHITSVLHAGKSNGGQMLGFLGSYSQRKSETVFEIVKDGDVSVVRPNETRNIDFSEWSFKIENGLPLYCGEIERKTKAEQNNYNTKRLFNRILAPDKQMNNTELTAKYMDLNLCSEKTAQNHIRKMFLSGFVIKDDNTRMYRLSNYVDDANS